MNYYIGIDLGTSAVKLLLMDGGGKITGSPDNDTVLKYADRYGKFRSLYPALRDTYKLFTEE